MDEMVAITTMHSQAMNLFGEEVNNLEARLEYLEINAVDIFPKDAIDPRHLCEVFSETIKPLNVDSEIKLVLFSLYSDAINSKLGVLYKSLNEQLIKAGVLPKIVLKTSKVDAFLEEEEDSTAKVIRKSDDVYNEKLHQSTSGSPTGSATDSSSGSSQQDGSHNNAGTSGSEPGNMAASPQHGNPMSNGSSASSAGGSESGHASNANGFYQKANQVVSQFLNGDAVKQGPGIPDSFSRLVSQTAADGKNYYERKEVMKALSRLQHSLMEESPRQQQTGEPCAKTVKLRLIDTEEIKRELLADIGNQHGGIVDKQVNVLDERSIDFVGMMFSAITEDESISKVISNLIMRLQIPVIKVAMLDQQLFTEEKHPAKDVLNLVSDAGKGVATEEDRVFNELESIVDHIIETFDIDISVFEEAVEALEQ